MTGRITLLFGVLAFGLLAAAQGASAGDWLTHYYEHPAPERFVAEVRALGKAGHLSNPKSSIPIAVFLGRVMAANPAQVDDWLSQLDELTGGDKEALLLAASLSGTRQARAYIARQPVGAEYLGTPLDIRTLDLQEPGVLDMLWADFFATGDPEPIRRVVHTFNFAQYTGAIDRYAKSEKTPRDRDDALREATFKAALWSLESNARQHRRVGDVLEQLYWNGETTQPEQLWLAVVLAKAMPEKYELIQSKAGQWSFQRRH